MTLYEPMYTRYLYDAYDCQYMIFHSIYIKDMDQVLFWYSELYFSGCINLILEWAYTLYTSYYEENHPKYALFMKEQYKKYESASDDDPLKPCYLGNMFINMIYLIGSYSDQKPNYKKRNIYIMLKPENIIQYMPQTDISPKDVLRTCCVYRVYKKRCNVLAEALELPITVQDNENQSNWLNYCIKTPVWQERIQEFNGHIVTDIVVFDTEEDQEAFYDTYGYEPEEQPASVHKMRGYTPEPPDADLGSK